MKRKNDLDLKDLPNVIEEAGGSRVQLKDHINDPTRASTLSEVIEKLKKNGGSVAKMINNPIAKKGAMALAGPAGLALSAADAMASVEDIGQGSDEMNLMDMGEDYRQDLPEEQLDESNMNPEEAHRWAKIRSLMSK